MEVFMSRILAVDDEAVFRKLLTKLLTGEGHEVITAKNGKEALRILETELFDLMIADIKMEPINGIDLLHKVKETHANMGVIMISSDCTIDVAVEIAKGGAYDFLVKPLNIEWMRKTVQHALGYYATGEKSGGIHLEYRETMEKLKGIVAESPCMLKVCETIKRIAPSDTNVLICGEKGNGKKLVALNLHRYSLRRSSTFLVVNCAALPEQTMDMELFGYLQETITDGDPKECLFETANGGTLFFNEIDAMSLGIQAKLFDFLRTKRIRKNGRSYRIPVDVRIIASSNEDLDILTKKGGFHEDLYCRLSSIRIDIPPLRNRPEDILPLVSQTLLQELAPGTDGFLLDNETKEIFDYYDWPGNVSELKAAVQHALFGVRNGMITKDALPPQIVSAMAEQCRLETCHKRHEQFKGRYLRAFLHDKERELLERISKHPARGRENTP